MEPEKTVTTNTTGTGDPGNVPNKPGGTEGGNKPQETTATQANQADNGSAEALVKMRAEIEKGMQSEIDRRVNKFVGEINELKKENDALKVEKMTEKQKAEYELKKQQDEIARARLEIEVEKANYLKTRAISESKLPPDAADFISGRTDDEIKESVGKFKTIMDAVFKAGVESVLKGTDNSPGKPNGPIVVGDAAIQAKINELKAAGKVDEALKLINERNEKNKK